MNIWSRGLWKWLWTMGDPTIKALRTTGLVHCLPRKQFNSSSVGKKNALCEQDTYMLFFSGCLTVWSPRMSVGPSRVSTPPSTPFSVGLILYLNITGSGGYLKTYWEVNSSTTWLALSSCKSTSRMFCELFTLETSIFTAKYSRNLFFPLARSETFWSVLFLLSLLSESSLICSGKSLRDGNSSSRLCESRLWMWVLRSYETHCSIFSVIKNYYIWIIDLTLLTPFFFHLTVSKEKTKHFSWINCKIYRRIEGKWHPTYLRCLFSCLRSDLLPPCI